MKEPKEVDDSDFRKIDPMLVNSNKPVYKFYKSAHKRACNYRQDKRRRQVLNFKLKLCISNKNSDDSYLANEYYYLQSTFLSVLQGTTQVWQA